MDKVVDYVKAFDVMMSGTNVYEKTKPPKQIIFKTILSNEAKRGAIEYVSRASVLRERKLYQTMSTFRSIRLKIIQRGLCLCFRVHNKCHTILIYKKKKNLCINEYK